MKSYLIFMWLALLATCALAWTKEDYEIFDLVSAVESAEGKGTTFYSWLEVSPSASTSEISKAYRKKSIQLHPDKNPGIKGIHERFARLGVIAAILRNSESRKRYDFFYRNGVPKWRGTGYYYSRFRPGVGTVLVFLGLLTSLLQHMVHRMNYSRDLARIETITREARTAAWGNKLIPGDGQKKVKINLSGGHRFDENGDMAAGRMLEMIVDGSDVFISDDDGALIKVDASTAVRPSISNTWILKHVKGLFHTVVGGDQAMGVAQESESDDASASEMSSSDHQGAATKGRRAAVKAGGMRRKATRARNH